MLPGYVTTELSYDCIGRELEKKKANIINGMKNKQTNKQTSERTNRQGSKNETCGARGGIREYDGGGGAG